MKPKYEPILLDPTTNYEYVSDITLYLMDVVILHNACVDILNQHPEMIGYNNTRNKLRMIIEEHNKTKEVMKKQGWDELVSKLQKKKTKKVKS